MTRLPGALALAALAALAMLALAAARPAAACVCLDAPLEERFESADGAVVGRVVDEAPGEVRGAPQRILTVEIDQRVKGGVSGTIEVRTPSGTDCDVAVPRDEQIGLLLTEAPDGAWVATACSVVDPGELVVVGGEPRGAPIKIAIGLVILALVLLLALVRLRRGSRPQLPGGAPP